MELTKYEEALIMALRKADTVPGNVVLWFCAGLEDAAQKIKAIDINRYNRDIEQIEIMEKTYKDLTTNKSEVQS